MRPKYSVRHCSDRHLQVFGEARPTAARAREQWWRTLHVVELDFSDVVMGVGTEGK